MRLHHQAALAFAVLALSPAAHAQDATGDNAFTLSGSATFTSQYRFRGVSLSDEDVAVQGSLTLSHASGLYVGTWGSSLAGFGSLGGGNVEWDALIGYSTEIAGATIDGGLFWYFYPGTSGTDIAELYLTVSPPPIVGDLSGKFGVFYAPKQDSIGDEDSWWAFADFAYPVGPLALKAHVGYSIGDSTLAGPGGGYLDYMIGVDLNWRNLMFNLSWVDTDIGKSEADAFYGGGDKRGRDIVDGAVLFSVSATF